MRSRRWQGAMAIALSAVVACSSGGTVRGFCGRYLDFLNDLTTGAIPTEQEFRDRSAPGVLGDPPGDTRVGSTYRRLLGEIDRGDEEAAAFTTGELGDICLDVLD